MKRARVIKREGQAESRIRMDAGANRVGLFGQKRDQLFGKSICQRLEIARPALAVGIVPPVEFLC